MKAEYPMQVIWDVIGYSRSRCYYQPRTEKQEQEEALRKAILRKERLRQRRHGWPTSHLWRSLDYQTITARGMDGQPQTCQPTDAWARATGQKTGKARANDKQCSWLQASNSKFQATDIQDRHKQAFSHEWPASQEVLLRTGLAGFDRFSIKSSNAVQLSNHK